MKRFYKVATTSLFIITMLVVNACGGDDASSSPTPKPSPCNPTTFLYKNVTNQEQALKVTDREKNVNSTLNFETVNLSAKKSTTITNSLNLSASVQVTADMLLATYSAVLAIDKGVSQSVTAEVTNTVNLTVPPAATGFGDYGVFVQVATGHLLATDCNKPDYGIVTSYTPIQSGWCTWVTEGSVVVIDHRCPEVS